MRIEIADLEDPQVRSLIELHQRGMADCSPAGTCFFLDLSGYSDPSVTLWGAWDGDKLAGIGAMKRLGAGHAEIKSMRTHPDYLRRGVARILLEHIIGAALEEGVTRLSLETGSGDAFEPALALYRKRGFENGAPFADYQNTEFNQCLHMTLN